MTGAHSSKAALGAIAVFLEPLCGYQSTRGN